MEKKEKKTIHRLIWWTQKLSDKSEDEELEYTRRDYLLVALFVGAFVACTVLVVLLLFG